MSLINRDIVLGKCSFCAFRAEAAISISSKVVVPDFTPNAESISEPSFFSSFSSCFVSSPAR